MAAVVVEATLDQRQADSVDQLLRHTSQVIIIMITLTQYDRFFQAFFQIRALIFRPSRLGPCSVASRTCPCPLLSPRRSVRLILSGRLYHQVLGGLSFLFLHVLFLCYQKT